MTNLLSLLHALLPQIVAWAQQEETRALQNGDLLTEEESEIATQIGVVFPERVRLLRASQMPFPRDTVLRAAAEQAGLLSPHTTGMALRYGVFIRDDIWKKRCETVAHELVHTAQYERLGGFAPFLQQYLGECLTLGYENSPLEREAIEVSQRILKLEKPRNS